MQEPTIPTVEELKRAYDEGTPQTLLSGLQVQMRSVRPELLLRSGKLPDILTPIVLKTLYESATEELDAYLFDQREQAEDALKMIEGVDAVCEQALVDPSIVPYLSLNDRMWIFKLAFMPAEVLSRFRLGQTRDVEVGADGEGDEQPTERVDVSG
jgi:hypothetical protein